MNTFHNCRPAVSVVLAGSSTEEEEDCPGQTDPPAGTGAQINPSSVLNIVAVPG